MENLEVPSGRSAAGVRWVTPLVVVALIVAAGGWMLSRDDDKPTMFARDGGIVEQFAAGQRASVRSVAGLTVDGDRFDSGVLKGSVVVYNVWGSWCAPCRKEAPDLQRLSVEMEPKGVRSSALT